MTAYVRYDPFITDAVVPEIEGKIQYGAEHSANALWINIHALCLLIYIQLPPSRDEEGYKGETGYDRFIDYLGQHGSKASAILAPFIFLPLRPKCLGKEMSRKLEQNWWRLKQLIESGKFHKYYKEDREMFKKVLTDMGMETLYVAIMSEKDRIEEELRKEIEEDIEEVKKNLKKLKIISDSLKNNTLKELTEFPPKI